MTVNEARKLLPDKTKDLIDAQVQFMISRIGDAKESEFALSWDEAHEAHLQEMVLFLYDMYLESKFQKTGPN